MISQCRDKGIQEALQVIPEDHNAAKTAAYFKADNSLYNIIISNLSGEALLFASQNFEVKEDTAQDAYLGNKLLEALKTKYSGRLTDQEAHVMEMKVLTAKCEKNVPSYVQCLLVKSFSRVLVNQLQTLRPTIMYWSYFLIKLESINCSFEEATIRLWIQCAARAEVA